MSEPLVDTVDANQVGGQQHCHIDWLVHGHRCTVTSRLQRRKGNNLQLPCVECKTGRTAELRCAPVAGAWPSGLKTPSHTQCDTLVHGLLGSATITSKWGGLQRRNGKSL